MKRILFVILFVLSFSLSAQNNYKLVEQSAKSKPDWIVNYGNYTKGYFMVQTNKAESMEDAQNIVMTSLLNNIASSVSVVVTGEIENNIDWTTVELDGKTRDEYIQSVKNKTTIRIAKMPALQGISLIKADIYWERYLDKKTKEDYYDYYILYPFSTFELQELIDEYNAQEKALDDKIDNYKSVLDEMNVIDDMLKNIDEMKSMMSELADDEMKVNKLKDNISLYEKYIDNIYIDVLENSKGSLLIQLKYDEKVMKTKSLPQLKSECARDFDKKHNGDVIELSFNTFDCYEQDDNYVEVRFTFGKKKLKKKINIKL